MTEPDVSIIVPIRNGAQYLEECVGFLKAQTLQNFEVIFVVDTESEDGSVELVDKLAKECQDSLVIHQGDGMKLGGNRNLGLEHSRGKAIWFVDADDAPSPDFVKDMYGLLTDNDVDFVCCNFLNVSPTGLIKERPNAEYHVRVCDNEEALILRNDEYYPVSVWSKMFRRDFLLDNHILFDESFAEDIIYTYRCIKACRRICLYDRPLYAYRQTLGSICRKKENLDKRGHDEIASYDQVDELYTDRQEVLRKNATMKLRSSGHMSFSAFRKYARSEKNRESYERYLKGNFEAWWHLHLPTLYFIAIRTYIKLVYKRYGTAAMTKRFW
ncbi:MAG: glycosyltransferase [archaeon]|nr:glycosyltransferase [archaeon]